MRSIKANVDSGVGEHKNITFNQLVGATRKYYQNQVAQGAYGKVDPRNAQLMTLMTELTSLKDELKTKGGAAHTTTTNTRPVGGEAGNRLQDTPGLDMSFVPGTELWNWRITKIPGLDVVICNGREYWFCSRHVDPQGRWNGMWVRHQEHEHDIVQEKIKKSKERKRAARAAGGGATNSTAPAPSAANSTQSSNKLVIKDKLKEVLCSKLMVSDSDADKLCDDICGQGKIRPGTRDMG